MLERFKKEVMINYDKLEITNRSSILKELRLLMSGYNGNKTEDFVLKIISLIKKAFRDAFLLNFHYTFEELNSRINNFDKECRKTFKKIEDLNKKEEFILNEKGIKTRKEFFSRLKNINNEIELETSKYESCIAVSTILKNKKTKNEIINFCNKLSILQFSEKKSSINTPKKIIFEFLWIINQIPYPRNNKEHKGILVKIKHRINKVRFFSSNGKNTIPPEEFLKLIKEAESALEDNDFFTAEDIYIKLLGLYQQSDFNLRKSIYKHIFNFWFRLHFYNNRIPPIS